MKYILMMNTMKAGHSLPEWPKSDLQAHIAFMMGLNKELRDSGELVFAEGLSFPDQAKLVRAGEERSPQFGYRSGWFLQRRFCRSGHQARRKDPASF